MSSQLDLLKNRVFGQAKQGGQSELTNVIETARQLSCIGEILGRDYEIHDAEGKLLYTIRQKPMAIKQLNTLIKEVHILMKLDAERENVKWGKSKGKRLGRK